MVFRHLYAGFQDIDTRVLNFYEPYAQLWEKRGHGRYGLPALLECFKPTTPFCLDFCDVVLNIAGFALTTPEPERGYLEDIFLNKKRCKAGEISLLEYYEKGLSRGFVALIAPFRIMNKMIGQPLMSESMGHKIVQNHPLYAPLWTINRHLRLPLLLAGGGFLAQGLYELSYALIMQEPVTYSGTGDHLQLGVAFLQTASSAYFKDGHNPNLGKKQKSLRQLLAEAWEKLQEKVSVKVPQPVPVKDRSLEGVVG